MDPASEIHSNYNLYFRFPVPNGFIEQQNNRNRIVMLLYESVRNLSYIAKRKTKNEI